MLKFRSLLVPAVLVVTGLCATASAPAQSVKTLTIKLLSLKILDEDDPMSNDEPYLVHIGFRGRLESAGGNNVRFAPGTLSFSTIGGGPHNNLGRSGDNWADEGGMEYVIDNIVEVLPHQHAGRQAFTTTVPVNQPGWAVGSVIVFFEEDGFSNATAATMRTRIRQQVENAIRNLSMNGIDTNAITNAVTRKVTNDLKTAVEKFDIGGIIRGVASAADPDDYGGVRIVLAVTTPGGGFSYYAGAPFSNVNNVPITNVSKGTPMSNFEFTFPSGNLSQVPWNARYTGRSRFKGVILQDG
jgi:hypothetical protein